MKKTWVGLLLLVVGNIGWATSVTSPINGSDYASDAVIPVGFSTTASKPYLNLDNQQFYYEAEYFFYYDWHQGADAACSNGQYLNDQYSAEFVREAPWPQDGQEYSVYVLAKKTSGDSAAVVLGSYVNNPTWVAINGTDWGWTYIGNAANDKAVTWDTWYTTSAMGQDMRIDHQWYSGNVAIDAVMILPAITAGTAAPLSSAAFAMTPGGNPSILASRLSEGAHTLTVDGVTATFQVVPEPMSLLLMAFGLGLYRRQR